MIAKFKYLPFLFVFFSSLVFAGPINIGEQIQGFSLKDQHGKLHKVGKTIRLVLFTTDKKGKNVISNAIDNKAKDYLTKNNTVYVADISGMPKLIAKLFALPKMRKLQYSILLDKGPSVTKDFPSKPNEVTLIYMDRLNIKTIEFTDVPEDIIKAIEYTKP